MTEKKVYKPNCCTECCFADECFSEARIKCEKYEIAMKEYYRGLAEGCEKARKLEKENAKLSKMPNEAIDFIKQEDMQCKLCSFYLSCRDGDCAYKDETPASDLIRAELGKRVEEHKNDNNCPDVMCDDCNKNCELKKIMGETNDR